MLIDTGVNVLSKHIEGLIATFPKISSISIGVPGSVDNGRIFIFLDMKSSKILI